MRQTLIHAGFIALLCFLAACGRSPAVQQEAPTPTPLPPDQVLERPVYTVRRGPMMRKIEINGRITPVDLVRLSFHREGRVEKVNVKRGDMVKPGDVLAELQQDDARDELREAEDGLVQAKRDLENAKQQHAKRIQQATLDLQNAQEDLKRLMPGGEDDPIRKAQQELEDAQREAGQTGDSGSEAKTDAEYALTKATQALEDAQKAYSTAYWEKTWIEQYGTDPNQPTIVDPVTGKKKANHLTAEQRQAYEDKFVQAERALRDAERGVTQAQRALDKARKTEIQQNDQSSIKVRDAQQKLDQLLQGKGNRELIAAQRNVQDKQLALEESRQDSFNTELKAVENAQRAIEKARKKVEDGRVIAPQGGEVLALSISEGDTAEAFTPVAEIADPSSLEVAAELGAEQMRQLAEGQPVELTLLARPDVVMPGVIRLMPAPYGSGGSGAVQEQDRTTRFQVSDPKGQELTPGSVAKISIVLERKDKVLLLPPEAVRAFEGRRFVIVRAGEAERRVTVKVGIETEESVEILESGGADDLKEGDVVVGQ